MSYAAHTRERQKFVGQGSSLTLALYDAIEFCAESGEDVVVVDIHTQETIYEVEADTKVDDSDQLFPAIVHTRRYTRRG